MYFIQMQHLYLVSNDEINNFAFEMRTLVISTSVELIRISPNNIVFISSDGNYSTLVLTDGESRVLTLQLGQLEKLIENQLGSAGATFIRIGRSLIINRAFVYYINLPQQKLILSDQNRINHTLNASKEALRTLKELFEQEVK